jgi:hypothetical protein
MITTFVTGSASQRVHEAQQQQQIPIKTTINNQENNKKGE